MEQSPHEVVVGVPGDLAPGETRKFLLPTKGESVEAFLVNVGGDVHAYVNRCRHVPMTLDWVDNQFLDATGTYIVCATHGALYRPDTGACEAGPPLGRALIRVPLRVDGDRVIATAPPDL